MFHCNWNFLKLSYLNENQSQIVNPLYFFQIRDKKVFQNCYSKTSRYTTSWDMNLAGTQF